MHPGANTDNSTPSAADRVRTLALRFSEEISLEPLHEGYENQHRVTVNVDGYVVNIVAFDQGDTTTVRVYTYGQGDSRAQSVGVVTVRSLDLAEDFIRRMINDHKENR